MPDSPLVKPGDQVRLRKPHPCGGDRWKVIRTGADLRLQCTRCGRTVLISREEFNKAFRGRVEDG